MWIVLLLTAAIVFAYMLFFADSAEMKRSQAMLIASATTIVVVTAVSPSTRWTTRTAEGSAASARVRWNDRWCILEEAQAASSGSTKRRSRATNREAATS